MDPFVGFVYKSNFYVDTGEHVNPSLKTETHYRRNLNYVNTELGLGNIEFNYS